MRVSAQQIEDILSVINSFSPGPYKLYLVGSRTKDHLKGGDIDLLFISDKETTQNFLKIKLKIINKIMACASIDDMKIDIIITTPESFIDDSFVSTLNESKLLLGQGH